jgi:hypothetical protein
MAKSAGALFIESDKEVGVGGAFPERVDRSLASHRFRQVAPATDEAFVSRVALRRLSTQVATDHFLGAIMASAHAKTANSVLGGTAASDFQGNVDALLSDLGRITFASEISEQQYQLSLW